jgi:hypothetical protein
MKRSTFAAALGFSLLSAASLPAFAGDDYVVLQSNSGINLRDGSTTHKLVRTFTLPTNVSLSTATSRSAVLQLEAQNVDFTKNEVYINPPTTTCTSDGVEDANQSASIGFLDPHPAVRTENFGDAITFSSAKLRAGSNTLLLCVRSREGLGGASGINLDNITVRNIVVNYQTN